MTVAKKAEYNTQCRLRDRALSLAGITSMIPDNKHTAKMLYILRSPKSTLRLAISRGTAVLRRSFSQGKSKPVVAKSPRKPLRAARPPTTKYNDDVGIGIDDYRVPVIVLTSPCGKNTPLRTIPKVYKMHRRKAYREQKKAWAHSELLSPRWEPRSHCVNCHHLQSRAQQANKRSKRVQETEGHQNFNNTKRIRVNKTSETYERQWLPEIRMSGLESMA